MNDNWRLRGQEDFLEGATLVYKKYWDRRPDDDHDHCEFCWTKFMPCRRARGNMNRLERYRAGGYAQVWDELALDA